MNYLKNLPRGTHSDQEIDTKDKTVNPVPMEKFIEPILKRVGLPPVKTRGVQVCFRRRRKTKSFGNPEKAKAENSGRLGDCGFSIKRY